MCATEARAPEHNAYEIVAYGRGETPLYYEQFGSYQGSWLMLTRQKKGFAIYKGSYGSCSGCDAYEAQLDPYTDGGILLADAKKFAADYTPFAVIPDRTMRTLCTERALADVLPRNLRDEDDSDLPPMTEVAAAFMVAAKLAMDWPLTLQDVQATENQELRQRALKAFGYERWLAELGGEVIHTDGENTLVKAGEIVFVHVKDASTDRRYLLRVPPTMTRVREAIAWTFGMTEADYQPTIET